MTAPQEGVLHFSRWGYKNKYRYRYWPLTGMLEVSERDTVWGQRKPKHVWSSWRWVTKSWERDDLLERIKRNDTPIGIEA